MELAAAAGAAAGSLFGSLAWKRRGFLELQQVTLNFLETLPSYLTLDSCLSRMLADILVPIVPLFIIIHISSLVSMLRVFIPIGAPLKGLWHGSRDLLQQCLLLWGGKESWWHDRCSTDVLLTFTSMYHDWCSACPSTKEAGWNHGLVVFFNRPAGFSSLKAEHLSKLQCKLPKTKSFAKQSATAVRLQPWKLFLRWRASWLYVVQTNIDVCPTRHGLFGYWSWGSGWRVHWNTACVN